MNALLLAALLAAPAPAAGVEVALDARVELAAALELLGSTTGPRAFLPTGAYASALLKGVRGCERHPAVAAYARLRRDARPDWPAQALVALTTCLDDGLAVKERPACRRSPLAASAADFAAACGLRAALDAAAPLAAPATASLRARLAGRDLPAEFKAYTGRAPRPARVAPSPALAPGRFWNGLDREDAAGGVVLALSPAPGRTLAFLSDGVALEYWHENGHALFDDAAPATSAPEGFDAAACYDAWPQCAREHLAQGLALRREPKRRTNPRLPFQARVAARFAEYEKNRAAYPDVTAFLPRLLDALGARPAPAVAAALPEPAAEDPALAAAVARAAKDPAGARADLEALAARLPDDGAVLLSLAVLTRAADKKAARAWADRAVAAAREHGGPWLLPDTLSTRAGWRREDGDHIGARLDLEEARAAAPLDWPRRAETEAALGPADR